MRSHRADGGVGTLKLRWDMEMDFLLSVRANA